MRDARPKISHCARVSQDHCSDRVVRGILGVVLGLRDPNTSLPRDSPSRCADNTDSHDAQRVLYPLTGTVTDIGDCRERACAAPAARSRIAPVTARQANVAAVAATEQRRLDAIGRLRGSLAIATARVFHVVVNALRDEDEVCEAEVDGEGDDGRDETGPESPREVRHVANEPDGEEGEGDAICRARFVVFN